MFRVKPTNYLTFSGSCYTGSSVTSELVFQMDWRQGDCTGMSDRSPTTLQIRQNAALLVLKWRLMCKYMKTRLT
ncbi:hypothetical protein MAR_001873 [Mya arenaria]|uniref:Uncharacterized protein n=1 Tax=Mya arenaria TaxID=6604 RepID=A0ABY7FD08_MYAAR|nr:hypothetical protein MAR_001873 [Mya arenaria]